MKTSQAETISSKPAPVSDAELAAILENSPWAKLEREAEEFAKAFASEDAA